MTEIMTGDAGKKLSNCSVYFDADNKHLIQAASKVAGLNLAAFCRMSALKEARIVLKNSEVSP